MNLNLKVSKPQQKNNIVVFFLSSDEKEKNDNYLSFFQALDQKLVDVEEVNEKGFFGKLKVTNKSPNFKEIDVTAIITEWREFKNLDFEVPHKKLMYR